MGTQEAASSSGRLVVLAMTAMLLLVTAGVAVAGHGTTNVTSYTGCLAVEGGTLTLVAEGNSPTQRCPRKSVVAHLGGGDITAVVAGNGLTGGGDNGTVTLALDPTFGQPQGCASGQVAKWNGSAWVCAADQDTQYSAGTGLTVSGTQFSIAPNYRVTNNQACGGSQFATGLDSAGALTCGTPAVGVRVFANVQSAPVGVPSNLARTPIVSLAIPAGAYSFTAIGAMSGPRDDTELGCEVQSAATGTTVLVSGAGHGHDSVNRDSIAMMGLRNFTAATTLTVLCATNDDGVSALGFGIQAIKLD